MSLNALHLKPGFFPVVPFLVIFYCRMLTCCTGIWDLLWDLDLIGSKHKVGQYTPAQIRVRDATSNDAGGPTPSQLDAILEDAEDM